MENRVSCYVCDAPDNASTDGEGIAYMEMMQVGSLSSNTLYPCKLTPSHLFPQAVVALFVTLLGCCSTTFVPLTAFDEMSVGSDFLVTKDAAC